MYGLLIIELTVILLLSVSPYFEFKEELYQIHQKRFGLSKQNR